MCVLHIYNLIKRKPFIHNRLPVTMPNTQDTAADMQALLSAIDSVLQPLAQLCIGKGLPIQAIEEQLRQAYVKAATLASAGANPDRLTSRISTMTGLTRREVGRIQALEAPARASTRNLVTELFTRWVSLPQYQVDANNTMALPRVGPAPSFESLAREVTTNVHPRSLLDTMCSLELVVWDLQNDTVYLTETALVPRNEWKQMMGFLGDNVGDHLRAAVTNVLGQGNEHFEQTLFADELSAHSLQLSRQIISDQWRQLMTQVAPQLEALMKADELAGRKQDHSLRLGLYSWMQAMPASEVTKNDTPTAMPAPEHKDS
ncbi:MAG: hypothetical protein RJA34_1180 [Pseudomonadota bacterium]